MDLKLTEHVINAISLLYKHKIGWNSDIWNFLAKKLVLHIFRWKLTFEGRSCIITSLWRHTLTNFHDFGINRKKRPYPILWYQTIILWVCQFQVHRGSNHPPQEDVLQKRLRKTCYKKGSGRRGLIHLQKWKKNVCTNEKICCSITAGIDQNNYLILRS